MAAAWSLIFCASPAPAFEPSDLECVYENDYHARQKLRTPLSRFLLPADLELYSCGIKGGAEDAAAFEEALKNGGIKFAFFYGDPEGVFYRVIPWASLRIKREADGAVYTARSSGGGKIAFIGLLDGDGGIIRLDKISREEVSAKPASPEDYELAREARPEK